jgi:NAD(P)-dependent dehydrogenase (short-subunit alcohol dehydrogenase family)
MKNFLKPVSEQVVVVIGASSGMGREAALDFAARGAKVVLSARSDEALDSIAHEIESKGGHALAVPADVSDFEQVKHVGDRAIERFGRIDTWAHFAGAAIYAEFEKTSPEEFKRVIDVNLTGAAFGAMVALPHLRRTGGGALIQVSSVEAEISLPYSSAYSASKHGMRGYLDALRMELKHEHVPISVTNIMPTGINTPFFDHARTKLGVKPMPIPPVYQPGNVVRAHG